MAELTVKERIEIIRVLSSVLSGLGTINQNDSNQKAITEIITMVKDQLKQVGVVISDN